MVRIVRPWLSAAAISLYRYAWSLRRYAWRLMFFCVGGLVLWLAWYIPVWFPQWNTTVSSVLAEHLLFVVIVSISLGCILFWLLLWKLPQWQVTAIPEVKDRLDLESKARQTMAQILGGAAFLVGLYFTSQTLRTTQESQITDRFTKAIEQLGKDTMAVRLGGIYALERIARDSERDHWSVMEVLTAFVRKHPPEKLELPTDVQAVLTVIGRRTRTWDNGETQRLDLSQAQLPTTKLFNANLGGANLGGANLGRATLRHAGLGYATLRDADLRSADLHYATLRYATLHGANLGRADLGATDLRDANLEAADLEGANLSGADLRRANLRRANLHDAKNLTQDQINTACGDENTKLPANPEGLIPPPPCPK